VLVHVPGGGGARATGVAGGWSDVAAGVCRDAEAAVVLCSHVRGGRRWQDHRGRGLSTEGDISGLNQSLAFDVRRIWKRTVQISPRMNDGGGGDVRRGGMMKGKKKSDP